MVKRRAKQVLKIEADAIKDLIRRVDNNFEKAVDLRDRIQETLSEQVRAG